MLKNATNLYGPVLPNAAPNSFVSEAVLTVDHVNLAIRFMENRIWHKKI